jgi:hypothetical protein
MSEKAVVKKDVAVVKKVRKPRESAPKINVSQIVLKLLMESQGASIEAVADAYGAYGLPESAVPLVHDHPIAARAPAFRGELKRAAGIA